MRRIAQILNMLVSAASAVGLLCVTLMMLHVVADVVGRYVFNTPVEGTITIVSNYYMVFLAFSALAVAETRDAHISVEVVADLMPKGFQPWLSGLAYTTAVGAFSLLAVRTWMEAGNKFSTGAALQQGMVTIPIWPTYYALPIGCGLMAVVSLWKLFTLIAGKPSGFVGMESVKGTYND
ncbi:TRAP-type C4-dicarboxylate transport system, small permease component [Albimonas donghaensis]|uniref:TRAP transporter small permease protein n=1 Tax=Albimonas donghaensis TaxID=356660 RepID=A0A1H3AV90_9RHOB|nr:TRAP transporter small permease [Albimonas donghaensis]MAS43198.1 TRAP transporter small permease [Paracoccaceae bacterium]MBR26945.1 TRAP transporter small permease [Paracoccaceae bacterium]SDX33291.1 TRAP-type C4-dicarboxylate transport system, small permease component [Albimonas donghaensis]